MADEHVWVLVFAPGPQCYPVSLLPSRHHCSTDMRWLLHLISNQQQERFHPNSVQELRSISDGQHPLPSLFIKRVFPHWLNIAFEEMVI
jgi:hypothetical protein